MATGSTNTVIPTEATISRREIVAKWRDLLFAFAAAHDGSLLNRFQLLRELVHRRDIEKLRQVGMPGQRLAFLAFHQNFHS